LEAHIPNDRVLIRKSKKINDLSPVPDFTYKFNRFISSGIKVLAGIIFRQAKLLQREQFFTLFSRLHFSGKRYEIMP